MNRSIKLRLIVMNVIQWAVWGSYLTSMGSYLASVGLATRIGIFYSMQGIVSISCRPSWVSLQINSSLHRSCSASARVLRERPCVAQDYMA